MAKTKSTLAGNPDPAVNAVAVTALAKSSSSTKHRDLLTPGTHNVKLAIVGTVNGKNWNGKIDGELVIGEDTPPEPAGSTPWQDLLHAALCLVTAPERQTFLASVSRGDIPEPACGQKKLLDVMAELKPAAVSYRANHKAPKRGEISFVPRKPA